MLPVEHILPALHQQLITGDAIVVAPPGAGKSTCLPLSLLELDAFKNKKIILLQPRRLAVRNIASYLASQLGEPVGKTIGYRIRGDVKVSNNTRLEIVTEGILTRMLQSQPELIDVSLVIFDEFHERSIHADFSLALCIEVKQAFRDDLRLLVMSATLDSSALVQLLPEAMLLESEGKSYPVDIVYQADNSSLALSEKISRLVIQVFPQHQRDCLVFLPGAGDINKAAERLNHHFAGEVEILKLFSELSKSEQQRALQPDANGKRKIVLATNIAETSLTIEGIEFVVDSGVEKKAVFQLKRGITHLQSQKISQASATQRAGRAGRLAAGTCYRLWGKEQHDRLASQSTPEILHSDTSSFILESAVWGSKIDQLALIDQPSEAQISQGTAYLMQLGLINQEQRLTTIGKSVHKLGCHPGVANMILISASMSKAHQSLACALAALFENKDPLKHDAGTQISQRIEYIKRHSSHVIWQAVRYWHKKLDCQLCEWPIEDIGLLMSLAFPHWIGQKSHGQRYLLVNGGGVKLHVDDPLAVKDWIVVGSMFSTDQLQGDVRVALAEALCVTHIKQYHNRLIEQHHVVRWDDKRQAISAEKSQKIGAINMTKQPMPKPPPEDVLAMWSKVITNKGVMKLPFNEEALQLIYRLRLAKRVMPNMIWPDASEQGLAAKLDNWLMPYLSEVQSWQQLAKLNFCQMISSSMDWSTNNTLNEVLPEKLKVPSGNNIKLRYLDNEQVWLSVRMQEVYGLAHTPSIAGGKVLLNVELLSPAGRVLQTTQDLAGFWQGSYKDVQKEMKGRYQKHFWPDDPSTAPATSTTKKKMVIR